MSTINSGNLVPLDHVVGWALVRIGGNEVRLSNTSEKTTKKRLLRAVNPTLDLKALRGKAAKGAMDGLLLKVEAWRRQGLDKADLVEAAKKAVATQARRDESRLRERRTNVVQQIRDALMDPYGRSITKEDLSRIWDECLVKEVMTR